MLMIIRKTRQAVERALSFSKPIEPQGSEFFLDPLAWDYYHHPRRVLRKIRKEKAQQAKTP